MECVTLAGTHGLSWRLQRSLVENGYRVTAGTGAIRILAGAGIPLENVPQERDFLLGGGRLLLLGGEGPLLARLHLSPDLKRTVEGEAASFHEAFPPSRIAPVHPISGVGYAFLRLEDDPVALGGPKGKGRFVHLAETDPEENLFHASLSWLRNA